MRFVFFAFLFVLFCLFVVNAMIDFWFGLVLSFRLISVFVFRLVGEKNEGRARG